MVNDAVRRQARTRRRVSLEKERGGSPTILYASHHQLTNEKLHLPPTLSLPIYLLFVSSRNPLQWSSFPAASFQVRLHFFTPAITASSSSSFRRLVFLWPFAPDSRNRGNLGSFSFFVSSFKTPARFFSSSFFPPCTNNNIPTPKFRHFHNDFPDFDSCWTAHNRCGGGRRGKLIHRPTKVDGYPMLSRVISSCIRVMPPSLVCFWRPQQPQESPNTAGA